MKDDKKMKNFEERKREFEEKEEAKRQRRWDKDTKKYAKNLEKEHGEADRKRQREEEEEENKKARSQVGTCIPGNSGGLDAPKRKLDGDGVGDLNKRTKQSEEDVNEVVYEINEVELADVWFNEIKKVLEAEK